VISLFNFEHMSRLFRQLQNTDQAITGTASAATRGFFDTYVQNNVKTFTSLIHQPVDLLHYPHFYLRKPTNVYVVYKTCVRTRVRAKAIRHTSYVICLIPVICLMSYE